MVKKVWTASEMGKKGGRRRAKNHSPEELAAWSSGGGKARAKRHNKPQIRAWGRLGGRPPKLGRGEMAKLWRMLNAGQSHEETARALGISTRTIGRLVAKGRAG